MHTIPRPFFTLLLLSLMVFGSGCSPESKKLRHLQEADALFDANDYDKAEVEYLNTLKLDPQNARSIGRLGLIYSAQGRTSRAVAYIMKGHELLPDDLDLRLKVGQLYHASGRLAEARKEASLILDRRPQDPEAPLLWVATMANPDETEMLRKRLLELPAPAPAGAPVLVALASLELRLGHTTEAEALLQRAKAADPKYPGVYTVLAALHIVQKNVPLALQDFQQAATLSPPRSPRILQSAQFKIRSGDAAGGKAALLDITRKTPDYLPAWIALADIEISDNKLPECSAMVSKVLSRDPQNLEALIIQGRVHNARNETDKAIPLFEKLAESYPKLPIVQQELGRAYALTGDLNKGIASLTQAVALAPGVPEPAMLLARLHSRKGDHNAAIALLRKVVEQHPNLAQARMLLADAYRVQGNFEGALTLYQDLEKQAPQNNQTPFLRGVALAQQGKNAEAATAFEKAFELTPDSPVPLEQLVNLQLREKKYAEATARVEAEMAKNPKLADFGQLLLAKVCLAKDDKAQAEVHLKKAIELKPDSPTAYYLLAGIYTRTNQQEKALSQLNQIISRDPKQETALMLVSVIYDQLGNYAAARDNYEKMLTLNPRSVVTLNNLAYLYSERLNDQDKALELAQKARQLMPNDGHGADTLGWILFKKRQYPRALTLLEEAADKLPAEGEIQFHLGQAHYMMGEEAAARATLQRAIQLEPEAKWQAMARQALSILEIEANRTGPESRPALDKALADRPDDPVALARIATLLEREGKSDQAVAALESAIKSNPHNVYVLLNLARLHGAAKHSDKALEYAKAARKLAPDDPDVAQSLGRLAYQNGDFQWGFSLLQEAARKIPNSADLQFDLGLASYSVGRLADAKTAMAQALALAKNQALALFSRSEEARQFLELLALAENRAEAQQQAALIERVLKADPASVPALMASAAISEQRNAPDTARQSYEKALARFPDFIPAKHRLALLGATQTEFDQKTYDWAMQARPAYPADALLAKTLGIQTYLKGDHSRSLALLKESLASSGEDAVTLYYLGMAQSRVKDAAAAKSLQRAIELGLKGDALTEAKKILAEKK